MQFKVGDRVRRNLFGHESDWIEGPVVQVRAGEVRFRVEATSKGQRNIGRELAYMAHNLIPAPDAEAGEQSPIKLNGGEKKMGRGPMKQTPKAVLRERLVVAQGRIRELEMAQRHPVDLAPAGDNMRVAELEAENMQLQARIHELEQQLEQGAGMVVQLREPDVVHPDRPMVPEEAVREMERQGIKEFVDFVQAGKFSEQAKEFTKKLGWLGIDRLSDKQMKWVRVLLHMALEQGFKLQGVAA